MFTICRSCDGYGIHGFISIQVQGKVYDNICCEKCTGKEVKISCGALST